MSNQNIKSLNDIINSRNAYMASLGLQIKNNDINLKANKLYKRTGQLSEPPTDLRSLDEKFQDKQLIEKEVRKSLREITDIQNTNQILNQMNKSELEFYYNKSSIINKIIREKISSRGVLTSEFLVFLKQYQIEYKSNSGLGNASNVNKNIIGNLSGLMRNIAKENQYYELYVSMGNSSSKSLKNEFENIVSLLPVPDLINRILALDDDNEKFQLLENALLYLKDLPLSLDINMLIRKVNQIKMFKNNSNFDTLNNQIRDIIKMGKDTRIQMQRVYDELNIEIDDDDDTSSMPSLINLDDEELSIADSVKSSSILQNLIQQSTEPIEQSIQTSIENTIQNPIQNPIQTPNVDPEVKEVLNEVENEEAVSSIDPDVPTDINDKKGYDIIRSKNIVEYGDLYKLNQSEKKFVFGYLNNKFENQIFNVTGGNKVIKNGLLEIGISGSRKFNMKEYNQFLSEVPIENQNQITAYITSVRQNMVPLEKIVENPVKVGEISLKKLSNFEEISSLSKKNRNDVLNLIDENFKIFGSDNAIGEPKPGINNLSEKKFIEFSNSLPERNKAEITKYIKTINEETKPATNETEMVMEGTGLKKKKKRSDYISKEDIDKEVTKSEPKFMRFGKYVINKSKLNNNILSIKRPSGGSLKEYPSQIITTNLRNMIHQVASGKGISSENIKDFSEEELEYFESLSKVSNLNDRLQIKSEKINKTEEMINKFQIIKGQIIAGNDNKKMIQEFKLLLMKMSSLNMIPKSQTRELMLDLVSMGY